MRGKGGMLGFPKASSGMRVGLLGGSFDPPHAGHVHITRQALRRFGLDRVWWLVSPGNPLKANGPAPIEQRMEACREIMQHPKVVVTDLEVGLRTTYTADTIERLQDIYPRVNFVWLMGADNLASVHKWDRWEWIFENVPIGVTSRPGDHLKAGASKAAKKYPAARLSASASRILPFQQPPAWCLLEGPVVDISSTKIRESGNWVK